jgi:hypothetical protein
VPAAAHQTAPFAERYFNVIVYFLEGLSVNDGSHLIARYKAVSQFELFSSFGNDFQKVVIDIFMDNES